MNLYINKLIVEKNGSIKHSLNLNKKLNIIEASDEVIEILKLLLMGHSASKSTCYLRFFAEVQIDKTYYIRGQKRAGDKHWNTIVNCENSTQNLTDEYNNLISAHNEIDSVSFFKSFRWQNYSHRIQQYIKLINYDNSEFSRRTNGYSSTRAFRGFITQYINNFKPIRLVNNKDYYINLTENGVFKVSNNESEDNIFLSECEKVMSHYLCYLSLADFWDRAEKIRNLNLVTKPLVVSDFLNKLDESIDTHEILKRTNKLSRQTILLS